MADGRNASTSGLVGHGVGLRTEHYGEITERLRRGERLDEPGLEWLELISENFFEPGGNPRAVLRTVREHFPIALHGVSLSLGSVDPLNHAYLDKLSSLIAETQPALVSDHLCWGSVEHTYAHDLLPLPFTEEALEHVAARIERVQARLGRSIAIENVSSYLQFTHSSIPEWEFLRALTRRTGCRLLLDLNNVFVSARNHGFDPRRYVAALPSEAIAQMHLAGHRAQGDLLLDTHDRPVCDDVWTLYQFAVACHGAVATCIEWDEDVPALSRLVAESRRAARIARGSARAWEVRHAGA